MRNLTKERRFGMVVVLLIALLSLSYIPSIWHIPFLKPYKVAFAGTVPTMALPWAEGDKDVSGKSIYFGGGPHSAPINYACDPNNVGVRPVMRMSGLDFDMTAGTNVLAVADGWVVFTGTVPGIYGDVVAIDHGDGFSTQYWHLQNIGSHSEQR